MTRRSADEPSTSGARLWWLTALVVVPYLLLGIAWAGSNPPGAAPDERAHLVKALGIGAFDIGTPTPFPADTSRLSKGQLRNASISRTVAVPQQLDPDGFSCMIRKVLAPLTCLPPPRPASDLRVAATTPLGSYPPFLYLPMGTAALAMQTAADAFYAARGVDVVLGVLVLGVGVMHLLRWLGPGAVLGVTLALTPMAVFSLAMVTTSGFEIVGGVGVAAVAAAAARRPESLQSPLTHLTLAVVGSVLVLSRQLGIVTLGVGLVAAFTLAGWGSLGSLVRRHRPSFLVATGALALSCGVVVAWELRYDHPNQTGSPLSGPALRAFGPAGWQVVRTGVGVFGWLDTPLPVWCLLTWLVLTGLLVLAALALGTGRQRTVLALLLVVVWGVAYVSYATVFFPVNGGLQGRHLLPAFAMVTVLSGVVVTGRLRPGRGARALPLATSAVAAAVQWTGLYWNGRRYATGIDAPVLFVGAAQWSPPGGWVPWLLIGAVGAVGIAVGPLLAAPPPHGPASDGSGAMRADPAAVADVAR